MAGTMGTTNKNTSRSGKRKRENNNDGETASSSPDDGKRHKATDMELLGEPTTLNTLHARNPSFRDEMMDESRMDVDDTAEGGPIEAQPTADKSESANSLRVLTRIVPPSQEDQLKEEVQREFAELLVPREPTSTAVDPTVTPQAAKANRAFEDRFLDFLVFKKSYGHPLVPKIFPQNTPLGRWTVKIRSWRRSNDERLTRSRIERLDKAGFIWDPKSNTEFWKVQAQHEKAEGLWNEMFDELMEFKNKHGHCHVPKEYSENPRLGRWVTKLRKHHKAKQEDRYHFLTDEKEKRLLEAGFVFNTKATTLMRETVLKRYEDRWDHFIDRLTEFKQKQGHCAVPRRWKKDQQLASWVMRQRFQWRKLQAGEHSYLTEERLKQLEDLGFVFADVKRGGYSVATEEPEETTDEGEGASETSEGEEAIEAEAWTANEASRPKSASKSSRKSTGTTAKTKPKAAVLKKSPDQLGATVTGHRVQCKEATEETDATESEDEEPVAVPVETATKKKNETPSDTQRPDTKTTAAGKPVRGNTKAKSGRTLPLVSKKQTAIKALAASAKAQMTRVARTPAQKSTPWRETKCSICGQSDFSSLGAAMAHEAACEGLEKLAAAAEMRLE